MDSVSVESTSLGLVREEIVSFLSELQHGLDHLGWLRGSAADGPL